MSTAPMVTGTVIADRFVIEGAAGSGGMSTVYQAKDLRTGHPVALKLLHHPLASPYANNRLIVEAQVLAELRHPGIVSYIAHGHAASGQPFLVLEWLEGEDLERRLQRQLLSLPECWSLLRLIADALAAAHRNGIVHRDIKPSSEASVWTLRAIVPQQLERCARSARSHAGDAERLRAGSRSRRALRRG